MASLPSLSLSEDSCIFGSGVYAAGLKAQMPIYNMLVQVHVPNMWVAGLRGLHAPMPLQKKGANHGG